MRIDNIRSGRDGTLTTRVDGFTLTHARECRFGSGDWPLDDNWGSWCNCFISRASTAVLPDGTVTIIPEGYTTGNEDRIRALTRDLEWMEKGRALDGRTIIGLLMLSIGGWGLAAARGIWGF